MVQTAQRRKRIVVVRSSPVTPNRDDPELPELPESVDPPVDMLERSGLRSYLATSDAELVRRPVELLARLAAVTRLPAITDALIFPAHPALRARWDKRMQRYVSPTSGKPTDCISLRDRQVHLHARGEPEPTSVVPFGKLEEVVATLFALEELDRFRNLTSVRVAQNDLDSLGEHVRLLTDAIAELRVLPPRASPVDADATSGTVEREHATGRPGAPDDLEPPTDELEVPTGPTQVDDSPELVEEPTAPVIRRPERSSRELELERRVAELTARREARAPLTLRDRVLLVLDLESRDLGSLAWLSIAGLVSVGTTWHGTTAIGLRPELAVLITVFLCGFLWTLLVGLAMAHDRLRKGSAEALFAIACIYFGFFTYYEGMTHAQRTAAATDLAERAHADLVASVYTSHASELEGLRKTAGSLGALKADEIRDGSTGTGRAGYGPRAKALAQQQTDASLAAALLEGRLGPLEAIVHTPIEGLTPDELHLLDVRIWSVAPAEWRPTEAPARELYVDTSGPSSPILLPLYAIRAGEPEAYAALLCAATVEGMMVWCGMAIERRRKERLIPAMTRAGTRLVREARDALASVGVSRAARARARYAHRETDDDLDALERLVEERRAARRRGES